MNKAKRSSLNVAISFLEQARRLLEEVRESEQNTFDAMTPRQQDSERGERIQDNADRLEDVIDNLDGQIEELCDIMA